jgi:hypothetical protein
MIDKIMMAAVNVAVAVVFGMGLTLCLSAPFIIWHFVGKYW